MRGLLLARANFSTLGPGMELMQNGENSFWNMLVLKGGIKKSYKEKN